MKKYIYIFVFCFQLFSLQAQEESVVCIHGFMTTHRSMKPVKQALKETCLDVYLWEYPSRRQTFQENACLLISFLQKIAHYRPGAPIHFVTHSIGALILRVALNTPECPQEAKIGRAVLVAPPNKGSSLARRFGQLSPVRFVLGPKSGRQLMCYEESDITCLGYFPEEMEILVAAGSRGSSLWFRRPNDGLIAVEETALNTPFYWRVYPISHGKLLKSRQMLCLLKNFLLYGPTPI